MYILNIYILYVYYIYICILNYIYIRSLFWGGTVCSKPPPVTMKIYGEKPVAAQKRCHRTNGACQRVNGKQQKHIKKHIHIHIPYYLFFSSIHLAGIY